jgi:hypothetical protein
VILTTYLHFVPRSRMRGAIHPLPQYVFMAWCSVKTRRDNFTFTLPKQMYTKQIQKGKVLDRKFECHKHQNCKPAELKGLTLSRSSKSSQISSHFATDGRSVSKSVSQTVMASSPLWVTGPYFIYINVRSDHYHSSCHRRLS